MAPSFVSKRPLNDIGLGEDQNNTLFFTPNKVDIYADEPHNREINVDEMSTTKPGFMDHHNKTVQRGGSGMFQNTSIT